MCFEEKMYFWSAGIMKKKTYKEFHLARSEGFTRHRIHEAHERGPISGSGGSSN